MQFWVTLKTAVHKVSLHKQPGITPTLLCTCTTQLPRQLLLLASLVLWLCQPALATVPL
jgi:hypothetical protein